MPHAPGLPDPIDDARFYAGVGGRRLVAFAIDAVAIIALSLATWLAFGLLTLGVGLLLAAPIGLGVSFLYRFLSLARASATPGMALTGIELRGTDGRRVDRIAALLHTVGFMVLFATVIGQMASVALMALNPDGRGLHDMLAGTAMINRPA